MCVHIIILILYFSLACSIHLYNFLALLNLLPLAIPRLDPNRERATSTGDPVCRGVPDPLQGWGKHADGIFGCCLSGGLVLLGRWIVGLGRRFQVSISWTQCPVDKLSFGAVAVVVLESAFGRWGYVLFLPMWIGYYLRNLFIWMWDRITGCFVNKNQITIVWFILIGLVSMPAGISCHQKSSQS